MRLSIEKSLLASLIAAVLLSNISCNKMLDISPEKYIVSTETYYADKTQLETALKGVYAILANGTLYGGVILGRLGLEADEGFIHYSVDRNTISYYEGVVTDTKILSYWRDLYAGINRANFLLASVDNPSIDIEETDRNNIKGQALFLRAYFYLMLATRFGGVPLILEPSTSAKIEDVQVPRTPVKEVYDKIIADMTQAADLVYDVSKVESAGRVSKSAVWGVLARTCLYAAGNPVNDVSRYAEAASWAKKVIQSGEHALNPSYRQIFINYAQDLYDIKESILEVEFYGNGTGIYSNTGGQVGRNNGIQYSGSADWGYSIGAIHPTIWLYNIYSDNDLRRDWAIAPYRYNADTIQYWSPTANVMGRNSGKFRREYETLLPKNAATTPENFPLLRYSDVLLMYAEALNEVNHAPLPEAYEAMNQVRRRAIGVDANTPDPAVDITSMDYEEFKSEIKKERARELCFEALRKDDLIRWGDFVTNMKNGLLEIPSSTASYVTSAVVYYTGATARNVLWPIPSYEIGVNGKLEQNPGW